MEPPKTPEERAELEQAIAAMLEGNQPTSRRSGMVGFFELPPSVTGQSAMDRERLAATAPSWLAIEAFSAQTKLQMLAMWIEAVMDAIELDHLEPDTWEALYLTYAVHALVEQRYHAALRFSEMVLSDPATRRPARLQPAGPQPVTLADLRDAMERVRARQAMR